MSSATELASIASITCLEEGPKRGWTIVDMKRDWNTILPAEKS